MNIPNAPMRVPAYAAIERLLEGLCLLNGCTEREVATIQASPGHGILPVLASIRAGDGREVIRLGSIKELMSLMACRISCAMLAKSVTRACRAAF